jgi:hypothetical protein
MHLSALFAADYQPKTAALLAKPSNPLKLLKNRKEVSHNYFHKLQSSIFRPHGVV